ncbi:CLUMA_CG000649, isoform A [Clunio marinus]|uniref:CLUMA_CG000649, isoform A n=1 Tax=Clunio marinus TaxID=568069 RepID=A0A1J1HHC3_9DIPT|nr:CLUMA_CG000649, isoform A [Clunio marinus]
MFKFMYFVIFLKILRQIECEAPSMFYNSRSQKYFTPTVRTDSEFQLPPAIPSTSYGFPAEPNYEAPTESSDYVPPTESTPAPIIFKHVYVHVPPPEPDYSPPQAVSAPSPVQKHYRIIFIKAPTLSVPTLPPLQALPQQEEKTIVYVLVKKPEDVPDNVIPTPTTTVPSKPEVYFIRYKTQQATTTQQPDPSDGGYYKK